MYWTYQAGTVAIFFVWLLWPALVSAQPGTEKDSLLQVIAHTENDTLKMDCYELLRRKTLHDAPVEAKSYALAYQQLAVKLQLPEREAFSEVYLASIYHSLGQFDSALTHFLLAETYFQSVRDTNRLAAVYNGIAATYENRGNDSIPRVYFQKAYEMYLAVGKKRGAAIALNNLSNTYIRSNQFEQAIPMLEKGVSLIDDEAESEYLLAFTLNLGNAYVEAGQLAQAQTLYEEMNRKYGGRMNTYHQLIWDKGYGYLLMKQGKPEEAIPYFEVALVEAQKEHFAAEEGYVLEDLSRAYEQAGQYKKALRTYYDFRLHKDSLFNLEQDRNLSEALQKFETEKKNQEIELLHSQNELKDLRIAQSSRTQIGLLIGIALLGMIVLLFFRANQIRRRANEALAEKNGIIAKNLAEKEVLLREIHHRVKNNLQVISSLLSLQSQQTTDPVALEALSEGRNRVKTMALIHQNLYQDEQLIGVEVGPYVEKLAESLLRSYQVDQKDILLQTDIDPMKLDVDMIIPIGLILNELISNALKYAFADQESGKLAIEVKQQETNIEIKVWDNGKGLPVNFQPETSASLGFKLVRAFAKKLKATLSIQSKNGTQIVLSIPQSKVLTT